MKIDIKDLLQRNWRLIFITVILAFAFVYARMILFVLLGFLLLIGAVRSYITKKKSYFGIIIPVALIALVLGIYYLVDYGKVAGYVKDHSPIDYELVEDGTYEGTGQGLRGPIKVKTVFEDGKIRDIEVLQHQEAISALDGLKEQILEKDALYGELVPATIHGSIQATEGYREAVINSLWKGIPEKPHFSRITQILNHFTKFRLDMTTWNALAILFCIALVLDYTLQPVLVRGTGQALNCYNCQTCVGVCPVKEVDGEPYPMNMILAARLGDYEKVKRMSKYCVACSRCAGKCPVGDSGPSIAAAANAELKRMKRKKQLGVDVG
jgi:ferredoxin